MNAKISVFVICVEAIIYLLLYNLRDCTFKTKKDYFKRAFYILYFRAFKLFSLI